jgi:ribosomal protein L37E
MDWQNFEAVWGVMGLSEAQQREVQGGTTSSNRVATLRCALQTYLTDIQNCGRSTARSVLLSNIRNNTCTSCGYGSV